jgi:hypothetical protein
MSTQVKGSPESRQKKQEVSKEELGRAGCAQSFPSPCPVLGSFLE